MVNDKNNKVISKYLDRTLYETKGFSEFRDKLFKSEKEFDIELGNIIDRIAKIKRIKSGAESTISYTVEEMVIILLSTRVFRRIMKTTDDDKLVTELYMKDPINGRFSKIQNPSGKQIDMRLGMYINRIFNKLGFFPKSNKALFISDVQISLLLEELSDFNVVDGIFSPKHYIKYKNGILNVKTKELYTSNSKEYQDLTNTYMFTSEKPRNFNFTHNLTDEQKTYQNYWIDFYKSICPNESEDSFMFHMQDLYSTMTGDGKGIYKIQLGNGGNGKSTNDEIHKAIAGEGNYIMCSLNQFNDDNKLNRMSINTAITLGDDFPENGFVPDIAIQNWKTLTGGGELFASKKYSEDVIVRNIGNYHQNVNSYPRNLIDNKAIGRRILPVPFADVNFVELAKTDPKIKARGLWINDALGNGILKNANQPKIEALESLIIDKVEPFDNYIEPTGSREILKEMLTEQDNVASVLEQLSLDGVFELPILPLNILNIIINDLIKEENPSIKELAGKTLFSRTKPYLEEKGFKIQDKKIKISQLKNNQFSMDLLKTEFNISKKLLNYTKYAVNKSNFISDDELKLYLKSDYKQKDYNLLSLREKLLIERLIFNGNVDILNWKLRGLDE